MKHGLRDWFGRKLGWHDSFIVWNLWRMSPLPKTQAELELEAEREQETNAEKPEGTRLNLS
jgi:hypothetical protein